MKLQLFFLSLVCCFSSPGFSQTEKDMPLEGTWTNKKVPVGTPGSLLIFSKDTLLVKSDEFCGVYQRQQVLKFKTMQDTLVATEIEFFQFSGNTGFPQKHFKNRHSVVKIPLCRFRNDCPEPQLQQDGNANRSDQLTRVGETTDDGTFLMKIEQFRKAPEAIKTARIDAEMWIRNHPGFKIEKDY